MTGLKMRKKIGDEILLAEVDEDYSYSSALHLYEHCRLLVKAEIMGMRGTKNGNLHDPAGLFLLICRAKCTLKWTGLKYKVREDALMTVYPLQGRMIIWSGGVMDLAYGIGPRILNRDSEISIMRADGRPRKEQGCYTQKHWHNF